MRWVTALAICAVVALSAADEPTVRVSVGGRVTRLQLEDYVARVLAGEGQPTAGPSAQQALAITARTYALANLNRHRREGFDLCDTTHCQVLRPATDVTRRAAQATAGRVLRSNGQVATVFYSALCGGHSELASQVWPGADDSSSHLHEDDACRDEPGWSSELSAKDIERALRAAGYRGTRLRDVRVLQRNASGRVARVRIDGFAPSEVSGHDFRMAMIREVGLRNFKSTAFEVVRRGAAYRFNGNGFGHGVGLCVIGAGKRAARGESVDDILQFYFPNLMTTPAAAVPAVEASKRAPRSPVPVAPRAGAADVPSRAPASSSASASASAVEHAEILSVVRVAARDIAKAAGLKSPGEFRVTVHPSVESFARATGQPWWISSASEGLHIELVPVSILRQRAQFERAIRREVARAIVEPALENRPMWVREGAVAYFADPESTGALPSASCPKDDELLRPLSAGAHRNALARAETCFRRQIARGKDWKDVR
jgi:SpoIID/LytB domain protein